MLYIEIIRGLKILKKYRRVYENIFDNYINSKSMIKKKICGKKYYLKIMKYYQLLDYYYQNNDISCARIYKITSNFLDLLVYIKIKINLCDNERNRLVMLINNIKNIKNFLIKLNYNRPSDSHSDCSESYQKLVSLIDKCIESTSCSKSESMSCCKSESTKSSQIDSSINDIICNLHMIKSFINVYNESCRNFIERLNFFELNKIVEVIDLDLYNSVLRNFYENIKLTGKEIKIKLDNKCLKMDIKEYYHNKYKCIKITMNDIVIIFYYLPNNLTLKKMIDVIEKDLIKINKLYKEINKSILLLDS